MPYLVSLHHELDSVSTRATVLTRTLASQSTLLAKILRQKRLLESWGVGVYDERLLPELSHQVTSRPYEAYFAHLLLPHAPLIYRADCSVDYESEPWERWPTTAGPVGNTEESWRKRYSRILSQIHCATKQLVIFFDTLKMQGIYDEATIIVHGDHGTSAYINQPSLANTENAYQRDYREAYSTLFAVKWPNGKHRLLDEVKSLNVLMAETAVRLSGKTAVDLGIEVISEDEPFVYIIGTEPFSKVYVDIFEDVNEH